MGAGIPVGRRGPCTEREGVVAYIRHMPIKWEEFMYLVDESNCSGCGACEDVCPTGAVKVTGGIARIDRSACNECGACFAACPRGAVYRDEVDAALVDTAAGAEPALSPSLPRKADARVPSKRGNRPLLAVLAGLAPAVLEAAVGLARVVAGSRASRASGRSPGRGEGTAGGGSFISSGGSQRRHRWRGGRG
jgi:ferredoxin